MSREAKSVAPSPRHSRRAEIEIAHTEGAALVRVHGMLDEHFPAFGDLGTANPIVLDVSGIKFISSFGVRQWLRAMSGLPRGADVYLVGCPRIFVEQLNMILNFGGRAQILTMLAPFHCSKCGNETDEVIDAVTHGVEILQGQLPQFVCKKCGSRLVLDELPEMYFACLQKYGPTSVQPKAIELLTTDVRAVPKQVIKPTIATPAPVKKGRGGVIWGVVIALLLAGLGTGLYLLVGPN